MRIAVVGGTGLVGRYVATAAVEAGHEPVVLARSRGVDITTGTGLDQALVGVRAVIDVSNVVTTGRRTSAAFFTAGTSQALAAGQRAGVRHHVALSIVGVERVELGYYQGKRAQEKLVLASESGSVLRATQFHQFAHQILARSRGPLALVPRMSIQPIGAQEVAVALVALAAGPPVGLAAELAGPEQHQLVDLARRLVRVRGQHRPTLGVRLPGKAGRAMATGALLPAESGPRGSQTFEQWLGTEVTAAASPGDPAVDSPSA